jgi:K+-sensing histidine kinase KdpD
MEMFSSALPDVSATERLPIQRWAWGAAVWGGTGAAAWALDGVADLGSQALLLVLAAAACGLWWPMPAVAGACMLAVLAFNWWLVAPRGSLHVLLHRDALLLGVMLAVSLGVAGLMTRQRRLADQARAQAQRIAQLLALADALRQADTPAHMHQALARVLATPTAPAHPEHTQALHDLLAQALARHHAQQQAEQARQHAQAAQWRTTWLAAIAHDLRTPLAAVLGAASSLNEQAERLDAPQRQHLAGRIVDEVSHLVRITDNALQLARLDGPRPSEHPPRLLRDWQSPEELVGVVLHRLRQRQPQARLQAQLPPTLPLVRCDAVLIVQLLENLLDNALRHSPPERPVTVSAVADPCGLLLRVRDHGPGLPAVEQAHFGVSAGTLDGAASVAPSPLARRRGSGLGLALCRAIAQEHGGVLRYNPPPDGGACFELCLPCETPPALPLEH